MILLRSFLPWEYLRDYVVVPVGPLPYLQESEVLPGHDDEAKSEEFGNNRESFKKTLPSLLLFP